MKKRKIKSTSLALFPRTQLAPVEVAKVEVTEQDFTAKVIHMEGMEDVKTIEQTAPPHMTFQVFTANNEEAFDTILGRLLGMNERPSWTVRGTEWAALLFAGNEDHIDINQQNHRQVYDHIGHIQDKAAAWWTFYGNK